LGEGQDDAERYIRSAADQDPGRSFAIVVAGEAAGGISLRPGDDVERLRWEIGYWLGEPCGAGDHGVRVQ